MTIHSTLLLAGALAGVLAAATPAASQPPMLRVKSPIGKMVITSGAPGSSVEIGILDITKGLIEIAEGPLDENGRKQFTLTRANLHVHDFSVNVRALGDIPVPFEHVGLQLRDAVIWSSSENGPPAPTGVFPIEIPEGSFYETGTPVFVMGARVHDSYFEGDPKFDRRAFLFEARVIEAPQGEIDLQHGKVRMVFVFEVRSSKPYVRLKATLTVVGDIDGYNKQQLPERPTGGGGSPTKQTDQPGGTILVIK